MDQHKEGDCYTRDCVLKQSIPFCGHCKDFPCNEIMVREKATVLNKEWLVWKLKQKHLPKKKEV